MSLVVMGASYKTMDLAGLERVSVPKGETEGTLREIAAYDGVRGAVVLSTCNRTELYLDAKTDRKGIAACQEFFAEQVGAADYDDRGFYVERGEDVSRHLFRVVCSLDSQVLGEAQILGQVKAAYEQAAASGTCTDVLVRLFKDALHVGKKARSETVIGKDSVSLSTSACKLVSQEFDSLAACRVLVVGAGEMADLVLTYLAEAGARSFTVTSRTLSHARRVAERHGGSACAFGKRYDAAAQADVMFCMTASPSPVIEAAPLAQARKERGCVQRKLVVVDEALPRDVERACADVPGVVMYDMESLGRIVDEGMAARLAAVGNVEQLVAEADRRFLAWMQQRTVEPTIREMYAKGMATAGAELQRALGVLAAKRGGDLDEDEAAVIEAYGRAIVKKMLHGPTARLRMEAETADSYYYTGAARYLFGLDTYPPGCIPHECADKACLHGRECSKGLASSEGSGS